MKEIKFIANGCVTPMAHVELYVDDSNTLHLYHYGSNICNLVGGYGGKLVLKYNWDYGNLTRKVMRTFTRQYAVEDQYDELKALYKAGKIKLNDI